MTVINLHPKTSSKPEKPSSRLKILVDSRSLKVYNCLVDYSVRAMSLLENLSKIGLPLDHFDIAADVHI